MAENFLGHRHPEEHDSTGRRAWVQAVRMWCYPEAPCLLCEEAMREETPCSHCGGLGYIKKEEA